MIKWTNNKEFALVNIDNVVSEFLQIDLHAQKSQSWFWPYVMLYYCCTLQWWQICWVQHKSLSTTWCVHYHIWFHYIFTSLRQNQFYSSLRKQDSMIQRLNLIQIDVRESTTHRYLEFKMSIWPPQFLFCYEKYRRKLQFGD